jgi:type IV secretory pathway VirB4 component
LAPLINFEYPIDISTFYYPRDTKDILENLKRKIAQLEATLALEADRGVVQDPTIKVALRDAQELQESMASGNERFFQYGLYMSIRADSLDELEKIARNLESTMAAIGVIIKPATLQQEQTFQTCIPYGLDKIEMYRNMDTTSLATTFPFTSSDLTMEKGILYGINLHNRSMVIFDRFSMPNANCVIFATSGAGKSYTVKLEAVRSLMLGVEVIIIDPEREYEDLCGAVGGEYISFSQDGAQKLNPFELSGLYGDDEDELRFKILSLSGLVRMMMGGSLTPEESAILDRALILTYKEKGITPDISTHKNTPPLLEDLYKIFQAMAEEEAHSMATRLEKFVRGSAAGIFDQQSNVDLKNTFTVFSIRDLVDDLRPMAMYVILDYIWTKIKRDKRKRLLIIDEAWIMMQYPDAAKFVFSIAKRARKYALGLSTITQDVNDFLASDYGKAIVNNASMQILLKQSPSAIDNMQKVFYLTEGEKTFLLASGVGEGIFFAGRNHVAIQVVASENEHNLITTNPNELIEREQRRKLDEAADLLAEQNMANIQPMLTSVQQTPAEIVASTDPAAGAAPPDIMGASSPPQ